LINFLNFDYLIFEIISVVFFFFFSGVYFLENHLDSDFLMEIDVSLIRLLVVVVDFF
jgi:hypothetical protein